MKLIKVINALLLTVFLTLPGFVMAEFGEVPIEQLITELAQKPEHHQAIALYYHLKAEEAKKQLAEHHSMKPAYTGFSKISAKAKAKQQHCDRLIKATEEIIREYESLAKEHEEEAKTL